MDATSTLQLGIQTSQALENLKALRAEIDLTKQAMGGLAGLQTAAGGNDLKSGLAQIMTQLKAISAGFDDLGTTITNVMSRSAQQTEKVESAVQQLAKAFVQTGKGADELVNKSYEMEQAVTATARAVGKLNIEGKASAQGLTGELLKQVDTTNLLARATDQLILKTLQKKAATEAYAASEEGLAETTAKINAMLEQQANLLITKGNAAAASEAEYQKMLLESAVLDQQRIDKMIADQETLLASKEAIDRETLRNHEQILLESAINDATAAQEQIELAQRTAMEKLQIEAQFINRVFDLQAAQVERQRRLNASYMTASPTSQLRTAREAQAYSSLGGDATSRFGSMAASADVTAMAAAIDKATNSTAALTQATARNRAETTSAINTTKLHADAMREAHSAARGLAGGFQAMFLTWGSIAPLLAGFAIASAVKNAAEGFAQVNYQMTFVKNLAEGTTESVQQMSDRLLGLATELGVSGEEAAKGLRALAQAGLDAEQAFQALPNVYKTALVGETSVANAAVSLTGIMNAFGMEVGQMGQIGDVLVKAGALSSTSVDSITQSMRIAAPTAHEFGVSLQETAAIMTTLAKSNIVGTQAGTSFKNMLKELVAPTSAAAKQIEKDLNFKAYLPDGQTMKPILQQIDELKQKLEPYDKESQGAILVKLFGEKGDKAFFSLVNMGKDKITELYKQIEDSGGYTAQVFMKLQGTLKGQWDIFLADTKNTLSSIGSEGASGLTAMLAALRESLNSDGLRSSLIGLMQSITTLGTAAINYGPPILAFMAIWKGAGVIQALLVGLAEGLAGLAVAMRTVAASSAVLTAASGELAAATAFLMSPFGMLIGVVVALASAYVLLKEKKESALNITEKEAKAIGTVADQMEQENARVQKQIELRQKGMTGSVADAQANADSAQARVDALRNQRAALIDDIQRTKDELANHKGGMFDANSDSAGAILHMNSSLKQLKEVTESLNKAEADNTRIANANVQAKKNQATIDKMNADDLAKQKAANAINFPSGNLHYDFDAHKKAAQMAHVLNADAIEEYRAAEKAAKDSYDAQMKIADAYYKAKLITTAQYYTEAGKAEKEYQNAQQAAEAQANRRINAIPVEADQIALRGKLALEEQHIANQRLEQAHQAALNEGVKVELDTVKALAAAYTFRTKTLPKTVADDARKRSLEEEKFLISTLPADEQAVANAVMQTAQDYKKQSDELDRQIDLVKERIRLNNNLIAQGKDKALTGDAKTAYDNAVRANPLEEKQLTALNQNKALNEATAAAEEKKSAAAAKALADQQKWNVALQTTVSLASKLGSTFGSVGTAIGGLLTATMTYGKAQEDIANRLAARKKEANANNDPVALAKAETDAQNEAAQAQMANYADLAGAAKGFFGEHTKGYEIMMKTEQAFRLLELSLAITTMLRKVGLLGIETTAKAASTGTSIALDTTETGVSVANSATRATADGSAAIAKVFATIPPPFNFAAAGAVAAALIAAGVSMLGGGGGGGTDYSGVAAARQKTQGTGTVLGDASAQSQSIGGSFDELTKNSKVELQYQQEMIAKLRDIKDGISGLVTSIAQSTGLLNPNISNGIDSSHKVLGGLFSSSTTLYDAGIQSGSMQSLAGLRNGQLFDASIYKDIHKESSALFGLFHSSSDSRDLSALADPIRASFSRIMADMADTVAAAGKSLGFTSDSVNASLNSVKISMGDLSLKGLSAADAEKAISARFSEMSDIIMKIVLPGYEAFQKGGEGYFQTVVRVANANELASNELQNLHINTIRLAEVKDKQASDIEAEIVRESLVIDQTNKYTKQMTGLGQILQDQNGTAQDLIDTYSKLTLVQKQLGGGDFVTRDTIRGAGGTDQLAQGAQEYYDSILSDQERLQQQQQDLAQTFGNLHIAVPQSNNDFKALVIALKNGGAATQYALGVILSKSKEFAEVQKQLAQTPAVTANNTLNSQLSYQRSLVDQIATAMEKLYSTVQSGSDLITSINTYMNNGVEDNTAKIAKLNDLLYTGNLSLDQQVTTAQQLSELLQKKYQTEKDNAQKLIDLGKQLNDYISSLNTSSESPLTNAQKLASAQSDYQITLAQAQSGDQNAVSALQGKADTYLKMAHDFYASSSQYTTIYDTVYSALKNVANGLSTQGGNAMEQATIQGNAALQAIKDKITTTVSVAQQQLDMEVPRMDAALQLLSQMEATLGVIATVPDKLASLPAGIAAALGDILPGLMNQHPTDNVSNPGFSTAGLSAQQKLSAYISNVMSQDPNSAAGGVGSLMLNMPYVQGETYQQRLARAQQTLIQQDAANLGIAYHASGLKYVPYNGYRAVLHQGERVLTAAQAVEFGGVSQMAQMLQRLIAEVASLREEAAAHTGAVVQAQYDSTDRAASKVVDGQQEAADNTAWQQRSTPQVG